MMLEYPDEYIAEDNWDMWLVANVPALAKLWNSSYDAYEMWKVLNNLTHEEYRRNLLFDASDFLASVAAVQPIQVPTGEIFHLKTK